MGDILKLLKAPALAEGTHLNYIRFKLEADDGKFRFPPATHYIATVEDLTDMLDYGSEDIDGMDDDADEEPAGRPPLRTTYTWWLHPKRITARTRKNQLRMSLLRRNQSAGVSGAALNPAAARTATPAQEMITLRTVPKTEKIPTNKWPNMTIGKMGKLA